MINFKIFIVTLIGVVIISTSIKIYVESKRTEPIQITKSEPIPKTYKFKVKIYYGHNSSSLMNCDSLQMISTTEAIIYVDGTAIKIFGKEIVPQN